MSVEIQYSQERIRSELERIIPLWSEPRRPKWIRTTKSEVEGRGHSEIISDFSQEMALGDSVPHLHGRERDRLTAHETNLSGEVREGLYN